MKKGHHPREYPDFNPPTPNKRVVTKRVRDKSLLRILYEEYGLPRKKPKSTQAIFLQVRSKGEPSGLFALQIHPSLSVVGETPAATWENS